MSGLELEGVDTNVARVRALKQLSKGYGLLHEQATFDKAQFNGLGWWDLMDVLSIANAQMPKWRSTRAIFNALNFWYSFPVEGEESPSFLLMERRSQFAAQEGVSMRTVMRLEDQGALALDDYISRLTTKKSRSDLAIEMNKLLRQMERILRQRSVTEETWRALIAFKDALHEEPRSPDGDIVYYEPRRQRDR